MGETSFITGASFSIASSRGLPYGAARWPGAADLHFLAHTVLLLLSVFLCFSKFLVAIVEEGVSQPFASWGNKSLLHRATPGCRAAPASESSVPVLKKRRRMEKDHGETAV